MQASVDKITDLSLMFILFQLLHFVKERNNGSGLSSQSLSQAVEIVKSNIAWIERNEKDLENWLKMFLSKKGELKEQTPDFSDPAKRWWTIPGTGLATREY